MVMTQPDGIIITISAGMLKEKGYRNWLRNFLHYMSQDDTIYWMRQGSQPKREVLYVYLCIGGKIRFRVNYAGSEGSCEQMFDDGTIMYGKAWLILAGPVVKPPRPIVMKGFQGFRYTEKLF